MLTPQSQIIRSSSVLSTEIAGELVMMDAGNGEYYGLDSIGTRVWNHLGEPTNIDSLCLRLLNEYDVRIEVMRKDLLTLVGQLVDKGLVRTL